MSLGVIADCLQNGSACNGLLQSSLDGSGQEFCSFHVLSKLCFLFVSLTNVFELGTSFWSRVLDKCFLHFHRNQLLVHSEVARLAREACG